MIPSEDILVLDISKFRDQNCTADFWAHSFGEENACGKGSTPQVAQQIL